MAALTRAEEQALHAEILQQLYSTYFPKLNVEMEPGIVYAVYECGHVVKMLADPGKSSYFKGVRIRVCPTCPQSKLVTKYKKCGCGTEFVGKKLQNSICCVKCSKQRKQELLGHSTKVQPLGVHADIDLSGIYCMNRSDCLLKHQWKATLPCKKCKEYVPDVGGREEAVYSKRDYNSISYE